MISQRPGQASSGGSVAPSAHEAVAVGVVVALNVLLNRVVPRRLAVPAGLATGAAMLLIGAHAGAGAARQGLAPNSAPRGVRSGVAIGVPLAAMVALGAAFPLTARFFRDRRITEATGRDAAYELLVHIPLATAFTEEIVFRSGLEGILSLRRSPAQTALVSAALFGAWHVLPALDRSLSNPGAVHAHRGDASRQATIVAGVCAVTAVASLGLSWLRNRTGSLLAPVLVHYAVNAGGFAGAWLAARCHTEPREELKP